MSGLANIEQYLDKTKRPRTTTRSEAAAALRVAGKSYEDIAFALGFSSVKSARIATMQALANGVSDAEKDHHREIANRRYELLLDAVLEAALDPEHDNHMPAQRQAKDLIERIVALNGAAAAQELIVRTPSSSALAAFVARVTSADMPEVEEHNPWGQPAALIDGTSKVEDAVLVTE